MNVTRSVTMQTQRIIYDCCQLNVGTLRSLGALLEGALDWERNAKRATMQLFH